ncbi:MAG TPA: hypothetical protein ENK23_06660 [Sorangium sp.]|nr:hypothetical protein [Sorangium sp.]
MEVRRKWASIVDERLAQRGLGGRARVVCEDARHALMRLTPAGCVTRVFVHFPDPWWKKRHRKRLVVADPVIAQVTRLLCDGGELFVQTDVRERADEYRALLSAQALLQPAGDDVDSPWLSQNPYLGRSHRERRADEDGLPVHRLRYRRIPRLA